MLVSRRRDLIGSTKRRRGDGSKGRSENSHLDKKKSQLIVVNGCLCNILVWVLIDLGATDFFLSRLVALKINLPLEKYQKEEVELPNKQIEAIKTSPESLKLYIIGIYKELIEWRVVRFARCDKILGMPWLEQYNIEINWRRKLIKTHNWKFWGDCVNKPSRSLPLFVIGTKAICKIDLVFLDLIRDVDKPKKIVRPL